jgi:pimeloyl-ACP methyl ester carboxylesterase
MSARPLAAGECPMRMLLPLLALLTLTLPAQAQVPDYPPAFQTQEIAANGTTLHVRIGGKGPAVLLLHGYGETGDMWAPLAVALMRDHRVIIPDLRGMGLSAVAPGGYDKKTQAADMIALLDGLKIDHADVVAHDIGNMVAYALTVQNQKRVTKLVLIDAPVPGIGPW